MCPNLPSFYELISRMGGRLSGVGVGSRGTDIRVVMVGVVDTPRYAPAVGVGWQIYAPGARMSTRRGPREGF